MDKLVIVLIAVHAIADFSLQPTWLAERKRKFGYVSLHAFIHAAVAYAALQAWHCWQAPVFILLFHALVDSIKQRHKDTVAVFLVDQALHILALLALAVALQGLGVLTVFTGVGYKAMVAIGGFVLAVQGAGFLVGKFMKRLVEQNNLELDGLEGGGKWIGQLERVLIFIFVFMGYLEGIGFLVAAKSILRFQEAKVQKMAEYVLIGTLLSFSLAIGFAKVTKWAMDL